MCVCPAATFKRPDNYATGKMMMGYNCGRLCTTPAKDCPRRVYLKDCGNKKKQFGITNKHYRDLANRMAYLKENAQNKVLFITLTFGEFKNGNDITEQQANECFSNFVDRLKKEYSRGNYIAVRERGDNYTKRLHFHCAIELPFVPFRDLNDLWNSCIQRFCNYSGRALYTDKDARFIRTTAGAVRYMCKYISKSIGQRSDTRIIFVSKEVAQARVKMRMTIEQLVELKRKYDCLKEEKINDYVTTWTIKYNKHDTEQYKKRAIWQLNNLFYSFVVDMFGTKDIKPVECYTYPHEFGT